MLTLTVFGHEKVDVDRVAIDTDVEVLVGNRVLPSAVVGDTTVVANDVDCVVVEADAVGFLIVERSSVAAIVVGSVMDKPDAVEEFVLEVLQGRN